MGKRGEKVGDVGNLLASYPYLQPDPSFVHSSDKAWSFAPAAWGAAYPVWGGCCGRVAAMCCPWLQPVGKAGEAGLDLSLRHFGT